jgi:hypothetical protein
MINAIEVYCTHGVLGGVLGIAGQFEDGRRAED